MKPWTKEELDYLSDSWGTVTIPKIAENLGRSVNAIKLKATRIGLGRHIHSGTYITVNQLAIAIKHDYWTVKNWAKYGLKIRNRRSVNKSYKVVEIEDFWKWAESHKPLIHFDRIEPLILGAEPKWVQEARRAAFNGKTSRAKWMATEDEILTRMLAQYKYSVGEIATALNRTEGAVKRRIYDLKLKQRPVKRADRKWTENQINILLDMLERGYSFEQIGKQLGRTGSAVRGKYEQLNNPEYMKRYNRREKQLCYNGAEWRKTKNSKKGAPTNEKRN